MVHDMEHLVQEIVAHGLIGLQVQLGDESLIEQEGKHVIFEECLVLFSPPPISPLSRSKSKNTPTKI